MKPSVIHAALALACSLGFSACQSTGSDEATNEWLAPSAGLEVRMEDQVKRLPWSHGEERIELIRWFATVGEPAYPILLELCLDNRPDVAASAIASLGATRDSRLVAPMHALDWAPSPARQVIYERARAYLRLGDWGEMGTLVGGLEDEDLWTRAWCAQALEEVTHQRHGFDPRGSEEERAVGVERWRNWLEARRVEGILVTGG